MTRLTATDIKPLLIAQIDTLARQFAPGGKRAGKWWVARNPTREDKSPSFGILLGGSAAGGWKDFATGDKGDVFALIQYVHGCDFRAALDWSRAWLGLAGAAPPDLAKRVRQAKADAEGRAKREEQEAARHRKAALGLYLASRQRPFVPSPAHDYLLSRGIDVTALPKMPGALGWLPDEWHGESEQRFPVMLAGFFEPGGQLAAIHKTFLMVTTDTPSASRPVVTKAPVLPARKIWPGFKGSIIPLARGASGLTVKDALKAGLLDTLVLTEGVEDGLSVALACPEYRVWAAGSLSNLCEITLPACCDQVIVCADNDWGKPQAEALLNRAVKRLARQGAAVRVARSTVGKDVNDALRG